MQNRWPVARLSEKDPEIPEGMEFLFLTGR